MRLKEAGQKFNLIFCFMYYIKNNFFKKIYYFNILKKYILKSNRYHIFKFFFILFSSILFFKISFIHFKKLFKPRNC
jgi:hypothetical protein